jgi:hypothetical protein
LRHHLHVNLITESFAFVIGWKFVFTHCGLISLSLVLYYFSHLQVPAQR